MHTTFMHILVVFKLDFAGTEATTHRYTGDLLTACGGFGEALEFEKLSRGWISLSTSITV